jgi:hypothetical protein
MTSPSPADRRAKARNEKIAALRSWEALGHMQVVHVVNHCELLNFIQELEENINGAGFEMTNPGPNAGASSQFLELLRRLHNFVASAVSLVDHTRNLMDRYKSTPTYSAYGARLAEVKENDVVAFVTKLRNYVLHAGLPAVGFQMIVNKGEASSYMVYIDREAALRHNGWPAPARRYLEGSDEKIRLREVIEDYGRLIDDLHMWLYRQSVALHGSEVPRGNGVIAKVEGAGGPITFVATFPPWGHA